MKTYVKKVVTPSLEAVLAVTESDLTKYKCLQITKGEVFTEKNSSFQGFALKIGSFEDLHKAYLVLKKRFYKLAHIMVAYRLPGESPCNSDYNDDGKWGGGKTLLNLLEKKRI